MLNNKTALKIFSLVAAILLWLYVMGEVDPEMKQAIRYIPVSYVNTDVLEEQGLAVVQEEELFITAVIEGKRSDVNDVKKSGLTAYVDVAACDEGENTGKINVVSPDSISVESMSQRSVSFEVDTIKTAEKPVKIEFTDTVSGTDKMVRVLEYEKETVLVTGAGKSVDEITYFKGVISANEASEDKSKWVGISLIPVNKEGKQVLGVEPARESTKVRIQLLSVKTVEIETKAENIGDGLKLQSLEGPKRIQIIGPIDKVGNLETVKGTIDLTEVKDKATLEILLDLPKDTSILEENNKPVAEVVVKVSE